jgi:hypothetical protein
VTSVSVSLTAEASCTFGDTLFFVPLRAYSHLVVERFV